MKSTRPAESVPPRPRQPPFPTLLRGIEPSSKKFIAVMGALGGAETLRFTSRKLVLDHEFAAGAPWISHVPTNQHVVAGHAGIFAAERLVAYELKKPHSWLPGDRVIRKLWWAYPSAMVAAHIKNGVDNMRTQGPGGCTSVECAEQMQSGDLRRRLHLAGTKLGPAAYPLLSWQKCDWPGPPRIQSMPEETSAWLS